MCIPQVWSIKHSVLHSLTVRTAILGCALPPISGRTAALVYAVLYIQPCLRTQPCVSAQPCLQGKGVTACLAAWVLLLLLQQLWVMRPALCGTVRTAALGCAVGLCVVTGVCLHPPHEGIVYLLYLLASAFQFRYIPYMIMELQSLDCISNIARRVFRGLCICFSCLQVSSSADTSLTGAMLGCCKSTLHDSPAGR
jgi:hypothetical protein